MADLIIQQKPIIDDKGNLQVNAKEGLVLPISWEDENGVAQDISGEPLFFEMKGKFKKALAAGADPTERLIVLTREEVDMASEAGTPFVLTSESRRVDGEIIPDVLWEGSLKRRGFVEAVS